MDNKTLDSKRYKRMLQISNDPDWMTKYAEIEQEETRFKYPSIKSFLDVLLYSNKVPYEDDKRQGLLGYLVAKELFSFYKETLDLAQPAFKSYKPQSDLHEALADDLYSFESTDLKNIKEGVVKALRNIGDIHIAALSKDVDSDKINDLIDFALTRAYITAYWSFLFANPLVTVLIENEDIAEKLTIFSALTKAQLEKRAEDDEQQLYEVTPEDLREDERRKRYDPEDTSYLSKKKEDIEIQELPGKKIRLSKMIEAFKVSRARWALMLASDPENPKYRAAWVNTDANIDYLERAFEALKEFVKKNPNNRFLKWHGQRIGDGDVFVTTTGADFTTLKMMSPPSFATFAPKVKTYVQETGETILETPPDSLYIPVKHWDPEKQGNRLALFLPDFEDIYNIYVHQKMANASAYREEIKQKTLSDLKIAHDHKWSNTVEAASFFPQDSVAKQSFEELLVDVDESGKVIPVSKEKATQLCNYIWKKIHKDVDTMLSTSVFMEDFEEALKIYRQNAVNFFYNDENLKNFLMPEGRPLFSAAIKFALSDDFGYPEKISHFTNRFTHLANLYASPENYQFQIKQFQKPEYGVECFNEIMTRVRIEVDKKDRELGFIPGDNKLRDPVQYQVLWVSIFNSVYEKYSQFLKRKKDGKALSSDAESAIRKLVKIAVEEMFPDAAGPIDLTKKPVSLKERAMRLYHSSDKRSGNLYTNVQAKMLREILTSPHFENQYDFDESKFEEIQEELSNREQKKKKFYEAQGAYRELLKINKEMGDALFPTKPDPKILAEYTKGISTSSSEGIASYQKQYAYAMVETIRQWIVKNMGPEDNRVEKIQKLLSEQPGGNALSMGLFAILGKSIAVCLLPDIEETTLKRFPAGGKARGAVGALDEMFQSDRERAETGALFGYKYQEIDNHRSNMAQLQAKAMMLEATDPEGGRAAFLDAENEARNEIEQFLSDQMKYLFKTVRTRKVRYETVEEAHKKPRVALSTNTFGGFIQQLFYSKSPYLQEYLQDPVKFRNWFKVSSAASFGNQIGERVKNGLSQLWSGKNAKYSSIEEFMEKVGAFADPMWALSPLTKALGSREVQKRKSGYISDVPDTAEDHLWRAAYNMNSLDPLVAEDLLKAYFDKRADIIANSFKGANPSLVKRYLIKRFKADGSSRASNPTNNPFKNMTIEEMKRIFDNVGITAESLEIYFSQLKTEVEEAEKLKLSHIDSSLVDLGGERDIVERQRLAKQLEDATQYRIDGRATTSDWILDNCSTSGLSDDEKRLLKELTSKIKSGLRQLIGTDPTKHLKVYGDVDSWKEAIEGVMASLGSQYDDVKGIVIAQINKVYEMADVRDSILKQYEKKVLGMEEEDIEEDVPPASAKEIVDEFKRKKEDVKKTVVRQRPSEVTEGGDAEKDPQKKKDEPKTKTVVRQRKDEPVETVDESDIVETYDVADDKPIPELELLAQSLERRVEELKGDLFAYLEYEGMEELELRPEEVEFSRRPRYVAERDVRIALSNVKDYNLFVRSLRQNDIKRRNWQSFVNSTIKTIKLLTAEELVEQFSTQGYSERINDLRRELGVVKIANPKPFPGKLLKANLGMYNDTYVFYV